METDLVAIKTALDAMTDSELNALSETTYQVPASCGSAACVDRYRLYLAVPPTQWPQRRTATARSRYPARRIGLRQRRLATPARKEDAVSIEVAIALRDTFAQDSAAVGALFDALVDLLTGSGQRH